MWIKFPSSILRGNIVHREKPLLQPCRKMQHLPEKQICENPPLITDLVMRVRSVGGRSRSFFRPAQFVSLGSFWAKTSHHCSRIRSRVFSVRLTLLSILNAHICPLKNNNSKNMKNNKQWINLTFPLSSYNFSSDSCCQLSIANCHFLSLPMWNTSSSVLAQRWPWHVFCSRENLRTLAVWWM